MYSWLCKWLPRYVVNTGYALWYALLIVMIVYFSGTIQTQLVYLHG